jgi:predicted transcriptional regulator
VKKRYKKYSYLMVRLKDAGVTLVEVAEKITSTPSSVSRKLNGTADFRLSELETIIVEILHETDRDEICKILNLDVKKVA